MFGQPEGILCRVIIESLSHYDKSSSILATNNLASGPGTTAGSGVSSGGGGGGDSTANLNTCIDVLSNCLLLLKSASLHNPQYIDRIMGPFMRTLQKLYRDHLSSTGVSATATSSSSTSAATGSASGNAAGMGPPLTSTTSSAEGSNMLVLGATQTSVHSFTELLIQSLELIKYRIGVMSIEMRKMFINSIFVTLIDKSVDMRLIRHLVRTIAEWVRYKHAGPLVNQIPSLKEKLVLLQRLGAAFEKRLLPTANSAAGGGVGAAASGELTGIAAEVQQIYLETIGYVYKDDVYAASSELKCKLESSFLAGLKCQSGSLQRTRQLFFHIFNANFASVDLYDRLCFIIITQNWEAFGAHYWIKQCIQMTLGACAHADTRIEYSDAQVAARFRFDPLLHAAECVYGSETAPQQPSLHPPTPTTSKVTPKIEATDATGTSLPQTEHGSVHLNLNSIVSSQAFLYAMFVCLFVN